MIKAKICIKNLCIKDIPFRSNRIFLKIKSGKSSFITSKYKINKNNTVTFDNMIIMPCIFKKAKNGRNQCQIRFSFRFEESNRNNFTRYGSFNIKDLDYDDIKVNPYCICRNLDRCLELPQVECQIMVQNYFMLDNSANNEMKENMKAYSYQKDQRECIVIKYLLTQPSYSDPSKKSDAIKNS
ncbi:hypothetical protein M9Y10_030923 [Tritrichomonas musculus]|uniref:C2 NT-type domain-containing protein n=1 Tax=Tritrichomonas musculus TaxID=1915356 RepID=A0ABR2H455_9EUKA